MAKEKKVTAEGTSKSGSCPWCTSQNVENEVLEVLNKHQCLTCGKLWDKEALGKLYSIELERGDGWVRETKARALKEA